MHGVLFAIRHPLLSSPLGTDQMNPKVLHMFWPVLAMRHAESTIERLLRRAPTGGLTSAWPTTEALITVHFNGDRYPPTSVMKASPAKSRFVR